MISIFEKMRKEFRDQDFWGGCLTLKNDEGDTFLAAGIKSSE